MKIIRLKLVSNRYFHRLASPTICQIPRLYSDCAFLTKFIKADVFPEGLCMRGSRKTFPSENSGKFHLEMKHKRFRNDHYEISCVLIVSDRDRVSSPEPLCLLRPMLTP